MVEDLAVDRGEGGDRELIESDHAGVDCAGTSKRSRRMYYCPRGNVAGNAWSCDRTAVILGSQS